MHRSLYNVHRLTLNIPLNVNVYIFSACIAIYIDSVNSLGIDILYLQERVYPDCDTIEIIDSGEIVVNNAHIGLLYTVAKKSLFLLHLVVHSKRDLAETAAKKFPCIL